jgi:hypothetical protein
VFLEAFTWISYPTIPPASSWQMGMQVFMYMACQTDLFKVVVTLHPSCFFPYGLNCGKQNRKKNTHDADNNQKLYQRDTSTA